MPTSDAVGLLIFSRNPSHPASGQAASAIYWSSPSISREDAELNLAPSASSRCSNELRSTRRKSTSKQTDKSELIAALLRGLALPREQIDPSVADQNQDCRV